MNELLNTYDDMNYSDYESHIQGIVNSITHGERQDQYKNWAKHPDVSVRETLVKNGYELDILIHDPLSSMRMEVVLDVLPGLKPRDSRLPHSKRAQFSSPTHG